jgi:hypothetical protein
MLWTLALLMAEPVEMPAGPVHNYLKGAEPVRRCGEKAADGEIVVCGRKEQDAQFRLNAPLPSLPEGLPKAEMRVFGDGKLSLHTASDRVGGAASAGAMLTLTKPF